MITVLGVWTLTALAIAGYVAHNLIDLPDLALASPEYSVVGGLYVLFFLLWWIVPSRPTRLLFVGWVWLHILGGGVISVLPIPFLPFEPAQTTLHYAMHGLYIVSHVPLAQALRRGRA